MSASLLEVQDLVKHFETTRGAFGGETVTVRAVDGVSFFIASGESFGLVGESGCGKSTVGRALLRLIEPDSGRVVFDGQDLRDLSTAEMRTIRPRLQLIFQDPYSSLNPKQRVGALLAEPLKFHGLVDRDKIVPRVAELLGEVGLQADAADRYPHEFSGGQRQRIAIARALALDPDLIVADEPVSALDVSVQAQVLMLLRGLSERRGLSFLFISHDLGVIRAFCQRLGVMYLGRIVETGPVAEVFETPRHPYTRLLYAASPIPDPKARRSLTRLQGEIPSAASPPSGCHFHVRCPYATGLCQEKSPALRSAGTGRTVACHLHDPAHKEEMRDSIVRARSELEIA